MHKQADLARCSGNAVPSQTGASTFGTPASFGVSQCAFLVPKESLGLAGMDDLSITAEVSLRSGFTPSDLREASPSHRRQL